MLLLYRLPKCNFPHLSAQQTQHNFPVTLPQPLLYLPNPFHVPDEVPDIDRFVAEKAEFAYAICEQALKPAPLTSRHIAVIDKAVSSMYEEYFRKRKDKRRRKNRPESPTIPVMRNRIMELYDDNEAAKEIVEQLEVFADGTLDIFAREQSISDENRFTV